jgi:Carboxypeptidase regulatory-like domain/TonB dependent receptor
MPLGRALALLVVSAVAAAGQRYVDLYGRVLDPSEAGIGLAAITVVNEETGFRRVAQSDPGGRYGIASLQPGSYKITVRKEGFRTLVQFGVHLQRATAARADFVLPVGSIEETITVEGTAPLVSHEDGSTGSRLERGEFERVPLNGRGLLTLLEMTPGTNVIPATRGDAGQFTASGQRANANYFTVDGVSANNGVTAGGLPAQSTGGALPALSAFGSMDSLISLESVQEMRVTTSSSVAEFGRLPGATVGLTSRSGSNEFHGASTYRIRNELLNANDWFANQAGYGRFPLRLHDFTQTLGGPLRRNRSFVFLSYQRAAILQPFVWLQAVPSAETRADAADWAQPLVDLFPLPTRSSISGGVGETVMRSKRPAGLHTGSIRFDQALGRRASLFARYSDSPSDNEFGGLSVNRLELRSQALTLGLNARATANTGFDLRVNESQTTADSSWTAGRDCALQPLTRSFFTDPTECNHLVRFWIGGVGQFVSGLEGRRRQRQFQVVASGSLRRGAHTLTLGADYRALAAIRRDPTGTLGVISDDLSGLIDRRKLWISRAEGQNDSARIGETSLWIQDTWQAAPRLNVAAGLRWEYSPPPLSSKDTLFLNPVTNNAEAAARPLWRRSLRNFAPRLGIAWQASRDGRTVLRAGGGLYYFSSMSIATDILNGGPLSVTTLVSSVRSPASSVLSFGFMPDLRLPYVGQWSLSLERAFGTQSALSLAYVGSSAHRLLRREAGGTGSTVTSILALTTGHGASHYHGAQAQYRRRMSRGVQALASYTFARSIDNASSDSFLLWAAPGPSDRGRSDFDLRQSLTISGSYEPARLKGWALDSIFRARSGFPITVLQAEEHEGIALMNAFRPDLVYGQPIWASSPGEPGGRRLNPAAFAPTAAGKQGFLGRNAIGGLGMWQLDLAVRREFRFGDRRSLLFRVEAFNALNHPNFADPARFLNSPVFGESTSMLNLMLGTGSPGSGLAPILQTGGPRSLQGCLRFRF